MPWINQRKPETVERVIAGLCYLSGGLIGLLYIILTGSRGQSNFFRFHFLQAILLAILGFLFNWCFSIMSNILGGMAGLFGGGQTAAMAFMYIGMGVGIIMKAAFLLLLYGLICAFLGKYAEIPVVSNIVRRNMGSF